MMNKRYLTFLTGLVSLFLLAGCVDFNITNISELKVRVLIQTPDNGYYTRMINPLGTASSFSDHGGGYKISTLRNEDYMDLLNRLREEVSLRLFDERATLSAADVNRLVETLNNIDEQLDQTAVEGGFCYGTAPDFSTVNAIINWNELDRKWSISCAVVEAEE